MLSWGEHLVLGEQNAAVINIHAKFRKTWITNEGSPWLSLSHKYLRGRDLLQNK